MNQQAGTTRYFIAKVANIPGLRTCVETGRWACRDRSVPPHPRHILAEALRDGDVVIVFSVNNCHGWHGYANMVSKPGASDEQGSDSEVTTLSSKSKSVQTPTTVESINKVKTSMCRHESVSSTSAGNSSELHKEAANEQDNQGTTEHVQTNESNKDAAVTGDWHYFNVEWKTNYIQEFGEQCLSSKQTEDLYVDFEKTVPINKCRNWQEIPGETGQALCKQIDQFYCELCDRREDKQKRELEKAPPPFYKDEIGVTVEETWRSIVAQVERDLGKVILACPFGSQRYNLSTPDSDTDMFIVYQARTDDLLGFNPPKQTIKNSERESCDYTIHEVFRYCELLLTGDARCVETLYLHDNTMVHCTQEWRRLKRDRKLLLNRDCLNKYLRDAQGSKGTKFLQKSCEGLGDEDVLPPKLRKLVYVIVRLLQNARDIVRGDDLHVYREMDSPERAELMAIRNGHVTLAEGWQIIRQLEQEISEGCAAVPDKTADVDEFLRSWILTLRYQDFTERKPNMSLPQC